MSGCGEDSGPGTLWWRGCDARGDMSRLTDVAFAPSVQIPPQFEKQVMSQYYYKNGFDLIAPLKVSQQPHLSAYLLSILKIAGQGQSQGAVK